MYLKSIELHGFKSFTDQTRLDFGPGVSAIVGPNGSGKSNIADAIRWVLGEQSAKVLRGSKMEDVIFAGTKKRKPLGMAEVSLTLDNSDGCLSLDFNEVTVTRRAYRSGDGEYLINHAPCRLKDVQNLFVDTGVGSDGFSIIGQGKVEEILNAKPEDRRSVIEETAGIVKYRNRKKEALRKLQETEQSLERVQDIISELSSRIEPLKEQAAQARAYRRLKAEGDELEINLLAHTMEELKVKLDEAVQAEENKKITIWELETAVAKLDSSGEELKLSLSRRDEEISGGQQELFRLSSQAEQQETEIKLGALRKESIGEQVVRLDEELKEAAEKLHSLDQVLREEEKKHTGLTVTVKEHRDLISSREDDQKEKTESITALEEKIESLKGRAFDLVQDMARFRNEINGCVQYLHTLLNINTRLSIQEEEIDRFLKSLEGKKDLLEKNLEGIRGEIGARQKEIFALDGEIALLEDRERAWIQKEGKEREGIRSVKTRRDLLVEMQRDYEGYYPGVKAVLLARRENHPDCREVVGVMAELITVPEEYRLAVETALGGTLQDIVTDSDSGAREAIKFLKKTKGGRATFLPLNIIRNHDHKDFSFTSGGIPGVKGFAADLVSCGAKVRPAVDFLLKRIIVTQDLDTALDAARLTKHQVKVVTLEGDVINPGGSLTGGSQVKRGTNLLSRKGEIEALTKRLTDLEAGHRETERHRADCSDHLKKTKGLREENLVRLRELEEALVLGGKDLEQINEAREAGEKNLAAVKTEIGDHLRERDATREKKADLMKQLAQQEGENDRLSEEISLLQEQSKTLRESLTRRNDGLTETRIRLAALIQEEGAVRCNIERLVQEKKLALALQERKTGEKEKLARELADQERDMSRTREALFALRQEQEKVEAALNQMKHERLADSQRLAEYEKEEKETARKLASLREEYHQGELKKNRWEMEWENHLNRLQEKFHLDFDQARQRPGEISSKKAAAFRISEIEQEIEALGPVNLNALDEYDQVSERYRFLVLQQKDLLEARGTLFKVIGEMDRIMTRRFADTFFEVSKQLNVMFNRLFGGGSAELCLTDPENLLETGIDIVVQPPGKKLQHLNLLSGGEKALTGIALLFALLVVKPSPFCVLDEIEAALDEANVERFAACMCQFAAQTQFIVVSHRQGTMEVADVLYGITMEENGVSKSLSVKLAEAASIA